MEKSIFTVSEISARLKSLIEDRFGSVWIVGEISNFKVHSSGHFYFSLKDANSQISAVMFRGTNRFLKFQIEDGLEVVVQGHLSVYEPRGSYQIIVEYLEPKGFGALQLAFEQLKKKLEKKGYFEIERKRPLPFLPKKIGIVTSPTGAAIRDLLNVLRRRYPNLDILLNPVQVQGPGSSKQIALAIDEFSERNDLDLMIVGRGGGSIEDLWAFNTEEVARAIYRSRIPVISAIGHEIDTTIADFVADLRAPTPSAAAELATPVKAECLLLIQEIQNRLKEKMNTKLDNLRERHLFFKSHLKHPQQRLQNLMQRTDEIRERLLRAMSYFITDHRKEFIRINLALKTLSPLSILNRGYAIVFQDQDTGESLPIKKSRQLEIKSHVRVQLAEGGFIASVIKKED